MKVLILGAKGLLGTALQKEFSDHEVIAYDREELDVTNFPVLNNEIGQLHPDIIINCVAWNDVDGAEDEAENSKRGKIDRAMMLNCEVVRELAKITKILNIPLVTFSTDHIFDGENPAGYTEKDMPSPGNAYAQSKYCGEVALPKETDKFYLVRTSRLYGPKPPSEQAKPSFVLMMVELGKGNQEIKIVNEEPGAFTYAKDLAAAIKKLIIEKYPYGIYHLVGSGSATWYECAKEIFSARGGSAAGGKYLEVKLIPVSRADLPRKVNLPKFSILLNTKGPKLRDWKAALHDFLKNDKIG